MNIGGKSKAHPEIWDKNVKRDFRRRNTAIPNGNLNHSCLAIHN